MTKQRRNVEGNDEQRRAAAREARAQGKRPSEMGATLGASKQRKSARGNESHQEKMDLKHEGKAGASKRDERARPGSRDRDPGRDDREAPFQ